MEILLIIPHCIFQWYREVRTHGGSAPVLLCGCKADLRHDKETLTVLSKLKSHPVTSEEVLLKIFFQNPPDYSNEKAVYICA